MYREAEDYQRAHEVLTQALSVTTMPAVVLNERAIAYRAEGEFENARDTYLAILNETPAFYDAHVNLGILYDLYLRQPELAHNHYQKYLEAAPQSDSQVEKWLVDLQRRHGIGANASVVKTGD